MTKMKNKNVKKLVTFLITIGGIYTFLGLLGIVPFFSLSDFAEGNYQCYDCFDDGTLSYVSPDNYNTFTFTKHETRSGYDPGVQITEFGGNLNVFNTIPAERSGTVEFKKNFGGKNIRMKVSAEIGSYYNENQRSATKLDNRINIGSCNVPFNVCLSPYCSPEESETDDMLLEAFSSVINDSLFWVLKNGEPICEGYLPEGQPLTVSTTSTINNARGSFHIDYVKFEDKLACDIPQGYMVVQELFGSGQQVSKSALRWGSYDARFCWKYPVFITDNEGRGGSSLEPLMYFVRGQSVIVPEGQTWEVSYIVNAVNAGLSPICSIEEVYRNGDCLDQRGFIFSCTRGVWNDELGTCTLTPDTYEYICEGRLQEINGVQTCIITLPEVIVCDNPDAIPNIGTGKCEYYAPDIMVCEDDGATYDEERQVCVIEGITVCPEDYDLVTVDGISECRKYPPNVVDCGDADYNPITDRCEQFPVLDEVTCRLGDAYNELSGKCQDADGNEYSPITPEQACQDDGGSYIRQSNGEHQCYTAPEPYADCSEYPGSTPAVVDGELKCVGAGELEQGEIPEPEVVVVTQTEIVEKVIERNVTVNETAEPEIIYVETGGSPIVAYGFILLLLGLLGGIIYLIYQGRKKRK